MNIYGILTCVNTICPTINRIYFFIIFNHTTADQDKILCERWLEFYFFGGGFWHHACTGKAVKNLWLLSCRKSYTMQCKFQEALQRISALHGLLVSNESLHTCRIFTWIGELYQWRRCVFMGGLFKILRWL